MIIVVAHGTAIRCANYLIAQNFEFFLLPFRLSMIMQLKPVVNDNKDKRWDFDVL